MRMEGRQEEKEVRGGEGLGDEVDEQKQYDDMMLCFEYKFLNWYVI